MRKELTLLFFFFFSLYTYAENSLDESIEDAKKFLEKRNREKGNVEDLATEEVAKESLSIYQGQDAKVSEQDYYKQPYELKDIANEKALTDENAQFYRKAHANASASFHFNPETDPLFARQREIEEKAHSLTETYTDCVDLPVGNEKVTQYSQKSCLVTGHRETISFQCKKELIVSCKNANVGQPRPFKLSEFKITGSNVIPASQNGNVFTFGPPYRRDGNCTVYKNHIQFNINDVHTIENFKIIAFEYDDWLDIKVNGTLVWRGVGPHQGLHVSGNHSCEFGNVWRVNTPVDLKPFLRKGNNTIELVNMVGGGGTILVNLLATRIYGCEQEQTTRRICETQGSPSLGKKISSVCIDNGQKTIEGVTVENPCWAWKERYKRFSEPLYSREPFCSEIEQKGCRQVQSKCLMHNGIFCERNELQFTCPDTVSKDTVSLCGDTLICPNGTCAESIAQPFDPNASHFESTATRMAIAEEMLKEIRNMTPEEINVNTIKVFSGNPKKCRKQALGLKNCCVDKGWGLKLNLTECDEEEVTLGKMREAEQTHFVGTYKSGGILDKRDYQVFCTYGSKLARIINEAGYQQLGRNFGHAKQPQCEGFTVDELKRLDFSKIDLSELYSDIQTKAPNPAQIKDSAEQNINLLQEKWKRTGKVENKDEWKQ